MKKRPGLASMTAVYRRELLSYLTTPTAYVFVAVFLFAIGLFTFQVGGFFETRRPVGEDDGRRRFDGCTRAGSPACLR